jgi:hypothetical protein
MIFRTNELERFHDLLSERAKIASRIDCSFERVLNALIRERMKLELCGATQTHEDNHGLAISIGAHCL